MSLLVFITFYIINFSFITKSQRCSVINDILVDSCSEGSYYDSINCICKKCDSRLVNENICYSVPPASIYGISNKLNCSLENGTSCMNYSCPSGFKVTELDNEGKWLGYLMCTKGAYPSGENNNNDEQFQLYKLGNENKQSSGINPQTTPITPNYNRNLVDYYNYSCLNGTYEKSCQYLANLCVLSLYYYKNKFCETINILSETLREKGIINNHLLKFDDTAESILEKKIEVETSIDSNDNKIHINLIDLYIAK